MAQDKVQGAKTGRSFNRESVAGFKYETATQLGIVMDNLSPARDGRLRVWIPEFGGDQMNSQFWRTDNKFDGVMHTYGMWMVTPDIGSQILCTFVNGDPEKGFWFACVPSNLSNWMLPAVGSSADVDKTTVSDGLKDSILPDNNVPPQVLPVAEFNENIETNINETFYNNKKPIHEFQANILFKQGLDRDGTRGAISSSAQRETPSHVFGISTPGRALTKDPADDPEYANKVNSGKTPVDQYSVPTRKGGHSFVMDDGDVNGNDQLIRLRTSMGHQILMNDAQKLIYIAHMDGTSWAEIDETGIKVYTAGDLSIRSEGNFNLHADKDINMQSGGNISIAGDTSFNVNSAQVNLGASESFLIYGEKTNIGAGQLTMSSDSKLNVSSGGKLVIEGSTIDINGGAGGNSISMPVLQKNKLADTTFDDKKTKLWYSVPGSVDSIVTVLPSHEPWTRTGSAPAPLTKSVSSSVCAPKTAVTPGSYALPAANGKKTDNGKVKGVPTPWSTDTAFLAKVKTVAQSLNCNYIDLLACMANETGATYDPGLVNSIGATGLIQFMPATAKGLGTTTDTLRNLSRVDQMDWVLKFYQYFKFTSKAPTPKLQDLYNCIFWPNAVGKPDTFIIAPAGSNVANQNKSLQSADGSITSASVGAAAAKWLTVVQQALANAGETGQAPSAPSGTLVSGSGITVTDGSGNPVNAGQSATDPGISAASGQPVEQPTCPAEMLAKTTTYNPSGNFGSSSPNLSQKQAKAMMAELGYYESKFDYAYVSSDGTRIGKYAVDAQYLVNAGYIKPDAVKQYADKTLSNQNSWTGRDGIQSQSDFFNSTNVQDNIQYKEFSENYAELKSNGGIKSDDDVCTTAGMMFVSHQMRSASKALEWRTKGLVKDATGRDGAVYYNHGRYAVDILAEGGAVGTVAQSAGLSGPNTTGINPDDVFVFGGATGTRSNFDSLNGTFKDAILKMAQEFKTKSGSKITITSAYRSPDDQEAIYQRWLAAGGGPNNPTAGGITTPAKPVSQGGKGSPHNGGVAIDSSQCPLISRTVDLPSYGLRWGGTFSKSDPVHIQMANAAQ
jgi:Type VI secretion system/phage-baseplate injector OB domain/D-alanyl-D-alanine carboxypeptidase